MSHPIVRTCGNCRFCATDQPCKTKYVHNCIENWFKTGRLQLTYPEVKLDNRGCDRWEYYTAYDYVEKEEDDINKEEEEQWV